MTSLHDKLCVSIGGTDAAQCLRILERYSFAEIRLDTMTGSAADIRRIFNRPVTLIATCRPGPFTEEERGQRLRAAMEAGAAWVDVEREAPAAWRDEMIGLARRHGCRVIVSHHDYAATPAPADLRQLVEDCFQRGADVAKIACLVRAPRENARLLALLDDRDRRPVIKYSR